MEQVAEAVRSNLDYIKGTPICFGSCWSGTSRTAQELADSLNVPVLAPTRPTAWDSQGKRWIMDTDVDDMEIKHREINMTEHELYQKIGELLWYIMPENAVEIYYIGCIYPDYSAGGAEWLTKENKIDSFEMGKRPYEIESQIYDLITQLRLLEIFQEKWTHFKVSLTEEGKIGFEFAYIPREDSWVTLFMKRVSDLKIEELDEYSIPLVEWEKRVRLRKQNNS